MKKCINDWLKLLGAIQTVAPGALLAGGALRDYSFGIPVKDLDIFVDGSNRNDPILRVIAQTHPDLVNHIDCDVTYQDWSTDVLGIWEMGGHATLPPVNLIRVREGTCTLDTQLARFDFGICQIAHDGNQLRVTEAYLKDRADRTFTLTDSRSARQYDRSLERFARISPRYPGWTLVAPERPDEDFAADFDSL